MSWKQLRSFMGAQLQRINPSIVRLLIRSRSRAEALTPAKGATIIFSPHKDDEVLGCGGLIIKKRRMNEAVYLVFMTDGCASHRSPFISPAALAARRTAEARACAQVMGVPETNIIFLEFEERFLARHAMDAQRRVARILREIRPAEIFVPYHREAQADHGETYQIVRQALEEIYEKDRSNAVHLYEYFVWTMRLWFWQIRELYQSEAWRKIDIRDVRPIKKNALAEYKSQTTALFPDPRWAVLPKDLLVWFAQPDEYYLKNALNFGLE